MTDDEVEVVYRAWARVDDGDDGARADNDDSSVGDRAPAGRGGHAVASASDGILVVAGGADRTGASFDDVWELHMRAPATGAAPSRASWRRAEDAEGRPVSIAPARSGAAAAGLGDGTVVVFGGQDPVSGTCFNDTKVLRRRPREDGGGARAWTVECVAPGRPAPPPRHSHVCVRLDARLMLLFGGASTTHGLLNDVWVFDAHEMLWSLKSTCGPTPPPREMAAAAAVRREPAAAAAAADDDDDAARGARRADAGWSECAVVVHGGRGEAGDVLGDCHLLDLETWAWSSIQLAAGDDGGRTMARCAHCAVAVSDTRIVCCGGFDGVSVTGEVLCIDLERAGGAGPPIASASGAPAPVRNPELAARLSPAAAGVPSGRRGPRHVCVVGGVSLASESDRCDALVLL